MKCRLYMKQDERTCPRCKQPHPREAFAANGYCKPCDAARKRKGTGAKAKLGKAQELLKEAHSYITRVSCGSTYVPLCDPRCNVGQLLDRITAFLNGDGGTT